MVTAGLLLLIVLLALGIGHLHNEVQTLKRSMNAAHLTIQVFAEKVAALSKASKGRS